MPKDKINAYFGKRKTNIFINLPLAKEEKEILKEALFKIAKNLSLDNINITETISYQLQPKKKEEEKKSVEVDNEEELLDMEKLKEMFE